MARGPTFAAITGRLIVDAFICVAIALLVLFLAEMLEHDGSLPMMDGLLARSQIVFFATVAITAIVIVTLLAHLLWDMVYVFKLVRAPDFLTPKWRGKANLIAFPIVIAFFSWLAIDIAMRGSFVVKAGPAITAGEFPLLFYGLLGAFSLVIAGMAVLLIWDLVYMAHRASLKRGRRAAGRPKAPPPRA